MVSVHDVALKTAMEISLLVTIFNLIEYIPKSGTGATQDNYILSFLRNCQALFCSTAPFSILTIMHEGSNFSISLTFIPPPLFFFFNFNHPSRCEGVSHDGFDLHFPNDIMRRRFHVLTSHL